MQTCLGGGTLLLKLLNHTILILKCDSGNAKMCVVAHVYLEYVHNVLGQVKPFSTIKFCSDHDVSKCLKSG